MIPFCLFIFILLSIILHALSQSKFYITIDIRTEHNYASVLSCFDPLHWFMNIVFLLFLSFCFDVLLISFYNKRLSSTSNKMVLFISLPNRYKFFTYFPDTLYSTIWYLYNLCWITFLVSKISIILSICCGNASLITTISKYWLISYKKCCEYGRKMNVFDFLNPWQNTDMKSITNVYLEVWSRYGLGATAKNGMDLCLLTTDK